jgi:hypothetical protein
VRGPLRRQRGDLRPRWIIGHELAIRTHGVSRLPAPRPARARSQWS